MLIAVSLNDKDFKENVKEAKNLGADIIELRVDTFSDTSVEKVREFIDFVHSYGLKTILTVRDPKEGGSEVKNREEIFKKLSRISDFVDVELRNKDLIFKVREWKGENTKIIVSYHDFERTPANWVLREILREAKRFGDIPKLAVKANSYEDSARLLCVANQEKYEKIVIAMGDFGKITRIAGFIFGSVISYASLKEALAPGQIPAKKLVELRKLFYEGEKEEV